MTFTDKSQRGNVPEMSLLNLLLYFVTKTSYTKILHTIELLL